MRHLITAASTMLLATAIASSAFAADAMDLKKKKIAPIPESAVRVVTPPAPKTNSISIEVGPEMWANIDGYNAPKDLSGTAHEGAANGNIKNWSGKIGYSHTFDGVWVVGASLSQATFYNQSAVGVPANNSLEAKNLSSTKAEVTAAYKYKLTDAFTLTPGIGLGYSWGWSKIHNLGQDPVPTLPSTGKTCGSNQEVDRPNCFDPEAYYQFTLAGDYKFNGEWTWNVFNLRYRNAFVGNWMTPKVSTGVTYNITSDDAVYVSAGWSWKNAYNNSLQISNDYADSSNISVGYKHAF